MQRFLEERKKSVLNELQRQFPALSPHFDTKTTQQAELAKLAAPATPAKPRELSENEICKLKSQLEALRGAELRRILQILAGAGMGKVDGEFPVEVQLQKVPAETLRRVMFEIQKMQEEDYVACVECGWN